MAARGGVCLVRDGAVTRLSASHREDAAALERRIRAVALLGAAGGAVGLRRSDRPALVAMVMPLPARAWGGGSGVRAGRALVLLRDPAVPAVPPPELLLDLYALTPAEAAVVLGAASGATAEAIAALRGVSANTVRRQIRAALEKTGAANLRDLTRLLGTLTP
jgi:DNA-binding CsgD family transcriptional regulator